MLTSRQRNELVYSVMRFDEVAKMLKCSMSNASVKPGDPQGPDGLGLDLHMAVASGVSMTSASLAQESFTCNECGSLRM